MTGSSDNADGPRLLSGDNPQIPKGMGEGPVQDYIAAMPGWKLDVGRRIDDIAGATLPDLRRMVKWNTPFYGVTEGEWIMGFHCLTRYVKVSFFRGARLDPVPPVGSKQPEVRYLHVGEDGVLDQDQFADWLRQAARLPGEKL